MLISLSGRNSLSSTVPSNCGCSFPSNEPKQWTELWLSEVKHNLTTSKPVAVSLGKWSRSQSSCVSSTSWGSRPGAEVKKETGVRETTYTCIFCCRNLSKGLLNKGVIGSFFPPMKNTSISNGKEKLRIFMKLWINQRRKSISVVISNANIFFTNIHCTSWLVWV